MHFVKGGFTCKDDCTSLGKKVDPDNNLPLPNYLISHWTLQKLKSKENFNEKIWDPQKTTQLNPFTKPTIGVLCYGHQLAYIY